MLYKPFLCFAVYFNFSNKKKKIMQLWICKISDKVHGNSTNKCSSAAVTLRIKVILMLNELHKMLIINLGQRLLHFNDMIFKVQTNQHSMIHQDTQFLYCTRFIAVYAQNCEVGVKQFFGIIYTNIIDMHIWII